MDLKEINPANKYPHPHDIARRGCLIDMLRGNPRTWVYADVGCGDQYVADEVRTLTQMALHIVDERDVRNDRFSIFHNDISQIEPESIDCLLLLDVIEHVQDPWFPIKCGNMVKPGGYMLVTVPAFNILFSQHDKALGHHRRYSRQQLEWALPLGFELVEQFYFFTSLVPIRLIQIIKDLLIKPKDSPYSNFWPWKETHWLTQAVTAVLCIDFKVNRFLGQLGIRFPGLSLYFLCRKV